MNILHKRLILEFVCFLLGLPLLSQNVRLVGEIQDDFLKMPLMATVSVYCNDSTLVVDSVIPTVYKDGNGRMLAAQYHVEVDAHCKTYLVCARLNGYDEAWHSVDISDNIGENETVKVPVLALRKMKEMNLNEVQVTATKVKMYYKGDTLVYDADAFKLPTVPCSTPSSGSFRA